MKQSILANKQAFFGYNLREGEREEEGKRTTPKINKKNKNKKVIKSKSTKSSQTNQKMPTKVVRFSANEPLWRNRAEERNNYNGHDDDDDDDEDNLKSKINHNLNDNVNSDHQQQKENIGEIDKIDDEMHKTKSSPTPHRREYVWRNIIALAILHAAGFYAFSYVPSARVETFIFGYFVMVFSSVGVQTGAHRLWAHRSYKASFGLRVFLSICHVIALQNDLYEWCRDHRTHHRWSDTDADPHNSRRGFFFAHMGWLMVRKHPEVKRRGRMIDLTDLERDPVVMFQRRFYIPLVLLFWGFLPAAIPVYCWNETVFNAFLGCVLMRYVLSLNLTWLVNSAAHLYGTRPYDKRIGPVEATCRHYLMGEGFHNYHHTFPWDYSASELGPWDVFNPATAVIHFFHAMGWAWDLRKPSAAMIARKVAKDGDEAARYPEYGIDGGKEYRKGFFLLSLPLLVLFAIRYLFRNEFYN